MTHEITLVAFTVNRCLTCDPMSSEESKQTQSLLESLAEADMQRRAHAMAESLVRRYRLAPMTGDDLYQQAMTRLIRYHKTVESHQINNPLAYLFKVLSNEARKIHDSVKKYEIISLEEVSNATLPVTPDMMQPQIESGLLLQEVLAGLDPAEQRLFSYVLEGFTTSRQLAIKLEVSHVTAAHRLAQLKAKIRRMLLER